MPSPVRVSLLAVALLFLVNAPAAFARGGAVPVKVVIETAQKPAPAAYVALVPPERPWSRPAAEAIGSSAGVILEVPEGEYRIVAGIRGQGIRVSDPATILASRANELRLTLPAMRTVSGTVRDASGQPLGGVTVGDVNAFVEAPLGRTSELAARHFAADWRTKSADDGTWSLRLPEGTGNAVVAELPGHAPAWRSPKDVGAQPVHLVMHGGAALRVAFDRAAPELVVTLTAKGKAPAVPAAWQAQFWARRASKAAVEWPSLAPGEYDLYAQQPDPRAFGKAVKLGTVVLQGGETRELRFELPQAKSVSGAVATVLVRPALRLEASAIEPFGRDASGAPRAMRRATEPVSGGTLLHFDTSGVTAPYAGTTGDRFVVLPVPDDGRIGLASVHDLGGASLHVRTLNESVALPVTGMATFHGCAHPETIALPVAVAKAGRVAFPAPAGCSSFVLDFEPFSPMVFPRSLPLGDPEWLGERTLYAAGGAAVRVATDDGAGVANAIVTVSARTDGGLQASVPVAERTTGPDGWARFERLPAGPQLGVAARAADGERSVIESFRAEPNRERIVDPLRVPKPAGVVVVPKLHPRFAEQFPEAHIVMIFLDPVDVAGEGRTENADEKERVEFRRLLPGRWQLGAMLSVGRGFQPILGEQIVVKAGETKEVEALIEPLVFRGRVTGGGPDLSGNIDILSARRADIVPSVEVAPSGEFVAILPRRDTYFVGVRPRSTGQMIWVGNTPFTEPAQPVEVALPRGTIVARLRRGGEPLAGATVIARMQHQPTTDVPLIASPVRTNADGEARIEGLLPGQWIVFVSEKGHAEKGVTVTGTEPAYADLEVAAGLPVTGTVIETFGAPVAGAKVTCLLPGPDGAPHMRVAFTGADGSFDVEDRLPSRGTVLCGVTSTSGAQGYRVVAGEPARLVLPASPAALRVDSLPPMDRFSGLWLVSRDGRVIDVSPYVPRLPGSVALTVPAVAPEAWKLVRVSTQADLMALMAGGGPLASLADVTLKPDERKTVDLETAGSGIAPAGR